MVAALTPLPVLGVPVQSQALSGLDSLLSIVQMPAGVPTATFAIGPAGATNAALFAVRMLALERPELREQLEAYRQANAQKALASTARAGAPGRRRGDQARRPARHEGPEALTVAVGILGGGQLGLMLAESLRKLDEDAWVLEPDPEAPCALRLSNVVPRPFTDAEALAGFFGRVRVATYDSENIPSSALTPHAAQLAPSLRVLRVSQDRAQEKRFLEEGGFGPVQHRVVAPGEDVAAAARAFGFPLIAKAALGGYDGKGQYRLRTEADLAHLPPTAPGGWVLEEVLALRGELSCIVARSAEADFTFPVFENLHRDHILDLTVLPARLDPGWQVEARRTALAIARALDVTGLLTVEFFLGTGRDGVERLFVNELAPRVHNSGHVTRQACTVSQFDALARILTGTPLTAPELHAGAWCMGQLLGDVWLAQGRRGGPLDLSAWRAFPEVVDVYLYGKREARQRRKMGHFVVHAPTADEAVAKALAFRAALEQR